MTHRDTDPNLDNLARIHDQYIDAYAEGNTDPDEEPDEEPDDTVPPWVDDYDPGATHSKQ